MLPSLNLAALMFFCPFAQMTTAHNAKCIATPSSIACSPILEDQAMCGECQSKETLGRLCIYHNQFPSSQYFWYSDLGFNDTFWNDLPLKCCIIYQEEGCLQTKEFLNYECQGHYNLCFSFFFFLWLSVIWF